MSACWALVKFSIEAEAAQPARCSADCLLAMSASLFFICQYHWSPSWQRMVLHSVPCAEHGCEQALLDVSWECQLWD